MRQTTALLIVLLTWPGVFPATYAVNENPQEQATQAPSNTTSGAEATLPSVEPDSTTSNGSGQGPKAQSGATSIDDTLNKLEKKFFVHGYPMDPAAQRLEKLELFVFGIKGSGEMGNRLAKLERVLATQNAPVSSVKTANPEPKDSRPQSLIAAMNSGIDNYNRHRYHNAEDDFEMCCAMAPGVSRVHAYLAVTKLQINERQSAINAFRTCYELDPFGTYGRYAKHCLIILAGDDAIRDHGPVDHPKILDATLDKIGRQSSQEMTRHSQSGSVLSRLRTNMGQLQAKKLAAINLPWDSPDSSQFYRRSNYVRTDAYVQAAKAASDATSRAALAQESANNLKHLLASKKFPGDAKLRAWGTTLNARYYGNETWNLAPQYIPREHPAELKATSRSLKAPPSKAKPATVKRKKKSR